MPRQNQRVVDGSDRVRGVFDADAFMVHHRHIFNRGRDSEAGCPVCGKGMEGLVTAYQEPVAPAGVGESSGSDPKGSTPPPRDRGGNDGDSDVWEWWKNRGEKAGG